MLIRGVIVGVGADERVVIVVLMGEGQYMRDGARSCSTFAVMGGLGIERMMVIGVPICERISASSVPRPLRIQFKNPGRAPLCNVPLKEQPWLGLLSLQHVSSFG